jgi:hypothetical protein
MRFYYAQLLIFSTQLILVGNRVGTSDCATNRTFETFGYIGTIWFSSPEKSVILSWAVKTNGTAHFFLKEKMCRIFD